MANLAAAKLEAAWHLLTLGLAVAYARGHASGATKALKTQLFPGVTRRQLDYALAGQNKRLEGGRKERDVLTTAEQQRLAEWIMSSARGKDPATNADISEKVVIMLKARRLDNKRRKHASGSVALTTHEQRLVTEADAEVSLVWRSSFQAAHPQVKRQKVRAADATRTKAERGHRREALPRRVRRRHVAQEHWPDRRGDRPHQGPARHRLGGRDAAGAQRRQPGAAHRGVGRHR